MSWLKKALNVALKVLTFGKQQGWFKEDGNPTRKLVVLLALLLPQCGPFPIPLPPEPAPAQPYDCASPPASGGVLSVAEPIVGQYIVRLRAESRTAQGILDVLAQVPGVQNLRTLSVGFLAQADDELARRLLALSSVIYVEQNGVKRISASSWGLDRIDQRSLPLDNKYNPAGSGSGVNVVVIDTGVATELSEFEGRVGSECHSEITFGGCSDRHGHGTHVAGTVASKTYGVSKATIWNCRALDERGSGSDAGVIACIDKTRAWASRFGGRWTINMSLGGSPSVSLDQAVCAAIGSGVEVVAAAGNDGDDACGGSPARVKQALTIGATDPDDDRTSWSNRGQCVDLFAPGENIRSLTPTGGSTTMSGTSMAAPHVVGALALYSDAATLLANATPDEVKDPRGSPNLLLYVEPAPAPTPTPTPSPSATPTPTPTPSPTPTPTPAPACYAGPWKLTCDHPTCDVVVDPGGSDYSPEWRSVVSAVAQRTPYARRLDETTWTISEPEVEDFARRLRNEFRARGWCATDHRDDPKVSHDELGIWPHSPAPVKEHIDWCISVGGGRCKLGPNDWFVAARGTKP